LQLIRLENLERLIEKGRELTAELDEKNFKEKGLDLIIFIVRRRRLDTFVVVVFFLICVYPITRMVLGETLVLYPY